VVRREDHGDRQGEIYLSQITVSHIGFSCLHHRPVGVGLESDGRCHWFLEGLDGPYRLIKLL
jgi:hypothetical protein